MQHVCYWNNDILKPIQYGGATSGEGQRAFAKLTTLLVRMMLRRTKVERADDLGLPPRVVNVRRDYFTEEEEEVRQRAGCGKVALTKLFAMGGRCTSRSTRTLSARSTRTPMRGL